jgi:hypothetical protein
MMSAVVTCAGVSVGARKHRQITLKRSGLTRLIQLTTGLASVNSQPCISKPPTNTAKVGGRNRYSQSKFLYFGDVCNANNRPSKKAQKSIFLTSRFELRLIAKGMIVGILVYTATKRVDKLPLKTLSLTK